MTRQNTRRLRARDLPVSPGGGAFLRQGGGAFSPALPFRSRRRFPRRRFPRRRFPRGESGISIIIYSGYSTSIPDQLNHPNSEDCATYCPGMTESVVHFQNSADIQIFPLMYRLCYEKIYYIFGKILLISLHKTVNIIAYRFECSESLLSRRMCLPDFDRLRRRGREIRPLPPGVPAAQARTHLWRKGGRME